MPYQTLLPVLSSEVLGGDARLYGTLLACAGAGALAGAIGLLLRKGLAGLGRRVALGTSLLGAGIVGLALSRTVALSALALAVVGFGFITQMAGTMTLLQGLAPADMRGRVMGLFSTLFVGVSPFGALAAGFAASHLGAQGPSRAGAWSSSPRASRSTWRCPGCAGSCSPSTRRCFRLRRADGDVRNAANAIWTEVQGMLVCRSDRPRHRSRLAALRLRGRRAGARSALGPRVGRARPGRAPHRRAARRHPRRGARPGRARAPGGGLDRARLRRRLAEIRARARAGARRRARRRGPRRAAGIRVPALRGEARVHRQRPRLEGPDDPHRPYAARRRGRPLGRGGRARDRGLPPRAPRRAPLARPGPRRGA